MKIKSRDMVQIAAFAAIIAEIIMIAGYFLFELAVNLVFCPVIGRLVKIIPYKKGKFF